MAERIKALTQAYMDKLAAEATPDEVADLFAEDVNWNIPGDTEAFPWIGRQRGRAVVANFQRDRPAMTERLSFRLDEILCSDQRAVIVAELSARVHATGKLIETPITIVMTFNDEDKIATYQLLEDSYNVSQAAKK